MTDITQTPPSNPNNAKTALMVVAIVISMVALSFAAVPLYRWFCQVTGFGGTTQVGSLEDTDGVILDRDVKVRFDASTNQNMPWEFTAVQNEIEIKVGEPALIFYEAHNPTDKPIMGTATFNVTPLKVGQYFNKVQCFCFTEQVLQPGETIQMPVELFVDPRIAEDPGADDVHTITLSYTFFRDEDWQQAMVQE